MSKLCKVRGAENGESGKKGRATYLIIAVRPTSGLLLDSDGRGFLDTRISPSKGVESDTGFEVIGDAVFGLGLWFSFRGMRGDAGRTVVVVVYSGMSCELV